MINGTVRAITLWQPWASFMMAGLKTYETRSWRLPEDGWVAIHAAKREPRDVGRFINERSQSQHRRMFLAGLGIIGEVFERLPRGQVLGLALFNESVPVETVRWTLGAYDSHLGDWTDGRFAWPVANIYHFPRGIPARGKQGIWHWTMPTDLAVAFHSWQEERDRQC